MKKDWKTLALKACTFKQSLEILTPNSLKECFLLKQGQIANLYIAKLSKREDTFPWECNSPLVLFRYLKYQMSGGIINFFKGWWYLRVGFCVQADMVFCKVSHCFTE